MPATDIVLWPCFICGRETMCPHREPELIQWAVKQGFTDEECLGADRWTSSAR